MNPLLWIEILICPLSEMNIFSRQEDTVELKSTISQLDIIDIRGYFTQQQQNTYSSQVHIKHSPTHRKHYTVQGILQVRIPECVAVPFFRGSSQPRNRTQVSHMGN